MKREDFIKGEKYTPQQFRELKEIKILNSAKYIEISGVSKRMAIRHLNDLVKAGGC